MAMKMIIIDAIEEVNELSGIINTYDESGDIDADSIIRMCAVAACLAFDKSKVKRSDQVNDIDDFTLQLAKIRSCLLESLVGNSYEVVKSAVDYFITEIGDKIILVVSDQSRVVLFKELREDLSLAFNVCDKVEDNDDGVSGVSDVI